MAAERPLHSGHRELLAAVGTDVLFSYEDPGGVWHVRMELVDVDPAAGRATVALYVQGGPPEKAPNTLETIADPVALEHARTVALTFAAARSRDPA